MGRVERVDWRRALGADDAPMNFPARSSGQSPAREEGAALQSGGNNFYIGMQAPPPATNSADYFAALLHMDRNAQADRAAQEMRHNETLVMLTKRNRLGPITSLLIAGSAALVATVIVIRMTGSAESVAPALPVATTPVGVNAMPAAIGTECFSLPDGEDAGQQLCLSNPVAVDLTLEGGEPAQGLAVRTQVMQTGGVALESSEETRSVFQAGLEARPELIIQVGDYMCRAAAGQNGVPVEYLFANETVETVQEPLAMITEGC